MLGKTLKQFIYMVDDKNKIKAAVVQTIYLAESDVRFQQCSDLKVHKNIFLELKELRFKRLYKCD